MHVTLSESEAGRAHEPIRITGLKDLCNTVTLFESKARVDKPVWMTGLFVVSCKNSCSVQSRRWHIFTLNHWITRKRNRSVIQWHIS